MLTQKKLKELLSYNKDTGEFRWKASKGRAKAGSIAGTLSPNGYIYIGVDEKLYRAHRLAWMYINGEFPKEHMDHINHDKLDNRIYNLRECSNAENHKNMPMQKNNTSGVSGVSWHKPLKKWRARIWNNGKCIHLGYFINIREAIKAREKAKIKYGYHPNHS